MNPLLQTVYDDIEAFLQTNQELFFNERDFQMHIAVYLRNLNKYDDVDVEYYVPYEELNGYVWENELRLDVVVRSGDEFVPIELKYKTKEVKKKLPRFCEMLDVVVMKHQGAQNLARYDFWKDVRRIELVKRRFDVVVGGVAVFLTNDATYLKSPKTQSMDIEFSMSEGIHSTQKHWPNAEVAKTKGRPDFDLDKEYATAWTDLLVDGVEMHYCIVTIQPC